MPALSVGGGGGRMAKGRKILSGVQDLQLLLTLHFIS
jgi:hypothetical protein